jgi:FtsZ-binding cell division protein ZapB
VRVYPFDSATVHTTEKPVASSEVLAERVRALERLVETVEDERDNLRNRLERSEDERRAAQEKLTALLTHQPETKADWQWQSVRPWLWVLLAVVAVCTAVAKWMGYDNDSFIFGP